MYLYLFFLILTGTAADYVQSGRCNSEKQTWPWVKRMAVRHNTVLDSAVTKIATEVIKAETYIRSFCNSHADHYMRETYGMDNYKLSLAVDDFDEETISVKVMHRLVYVKAEDCSASYADVRVLPEVVDTTKGKWRYVLGELTIYFPYIRVPDMQIETSCGAAVNTDVIIVPKCEEGQDLEPDLEIKFGDVVQKETFKKYLVKRV